MRFLSCFLFLCLSSLVATQVRANDASGYGIGGHWRLLSGEHKSIQMVREHVVLRQLPSDLIETTADFEFRNYGKSTTVTMGFPERSFGDVVSLKPQLMGFCSWVDGRQVAVRRVSSYKDESLVLNFYVKRVRFAAGQTHHVRVHYRSESGAGYSNGERSLMYEFTGGNWRGKVKESVLDIALLPGHHHVDSLAELRRINPGATVEQRKNLYRFRWRNWQAEHDFEFPLNSEFPNSLYGRDYPYGTSIKTAAPSLLIVPGRPLRWHDDLWMPNEPHGFVYDGHLWIKARWLGEALATDGASVADYFHYDAKNQRVLFLSHAGWVAISAQGAKSNGKRWPPDAMLPISGGRGTLYLPAKSIERALHLRFTYNTKKQQLDYSQTHS